MGAQSSKENERKEDEDDVIGVVLSSVPIDLKTFENRFDSWMMTKAVRLYYFFSYFFHVH